MKILQINIFGNLSTGRIAVDLYHMIRDSGNDGVVAFARNKIDNDVPHILIGNKRSVCIDGILTRITDRAGFYSKRVTHELIKKIKDYNPSIIHLHNLHGYYINIEVLFNYLRKSEKPVVWTLHDCWAFTGHCCYYSIVGCNKWVNGCNKCPQKKEYPASYILDNSNDNYKRKKELFLSVPKLHLVCVSQWLENEVKKSFLKDIHSTVIYNGIDTDIFHPTKSNFRKKYGIEDKFIILGVASTWGKRKGLVDFLKLNEMLYGNEIIVLVGLNKKELNSIPSTIIGIRRTDSPQELAGIYSSSDVFFNASVEETFGLPTIEAMACGTPSIVYNATALPEAITKENGFVVEPHNLESVISCIHYIKKNSIRIKRMNNRFDKNKSYNAYMKLYEEVCQDE